MDFFLRLNLNQMVVGALIDNKGKPVCCEMWPGNTTDVKTLIPVIDRVRSRFYAGPFCVVADRGMISTAIEKDSVSIDQEKIQQDLKALQEVHIEDNGKSLALRTECLGTCGKVFKAVAVAVPPTIREL